MTGSLTLNPLTAAAIEEEHGVPAVLNLRSFARRRSFKKIRIERAVEPDLFAGILAWLEGQQGDALADVALDRRLKLWRAGLLISPAEQDAVPAGVGPTLSDGHAIALALCPAAANLLRDGPRVASNPVQPDSGLSAEGYCAVAPVISPADVAAMNAFYDVLRGGDWLDLNTNGSKRYVIHNDPVARRVHLALTPYFSALAGTALKPSYSYASDYCDESPLLRHTDRPQCEITFSLYLDYRPEPAGDICPWPLVVHPPNGPVAIHQQRGGGAAMRGRVLPHSRPALPPGDGARLVFLHYVLESFDGSLD